MFKILVFTLISGFAFAEDTCNHTTTAFNCVKYIKNYDGDTVKVNIPNVHPLLGKGIEVRVFGVDSPEMKTHDNCEKNVAKQAQKIVEGLLKNAKRIDLKDIGRDKYFRVLANVYADGILIKDVLLKEKMAYIYDGGTKKKMDWCPLAKKL